MKKKRAIRRGLVAAVLIVAAAALLGVLAVRNADYGFARQVSAAEQKRRLEVVSRAVSWLDTEEGTAAHAKILSIYNSHEPLAQGYEVKPEDEWCATFVSAVAIQSGMTDIIPTECGCQRQIGLFQALTRWEEADDYVPLPGDIIYYCWSDNDLSGDCTGWSDHVGIVVGTWHGFIKVIEGNVGDRVAYRYVPVNATGIRGYGLPNYEED